MGMPVQQLSANDIPLMLQLLETFGEAFNDAQHLYSQRTKRVVP